MILTTVLPALSLRRRTLATITVAFGLSIKQLFSINAHFAKWLNRFSSFAIARKRYRQGQPALRPTTVGLASFGFLMPELRHDPFDQLFACAERALQSRCFGGLVSSAGFGVGFETLAALGFSDLGGCCLGR